VSVAFYTDVHVPAAVSRGALARGLNVLTSQEDGTTETPDPELLDRATSLGRVLVTQDKDFLVEGASRQRAGIFFAGLIFAPQLAVGIGKFIRDLEAINNSLQPEMLRNHIIHLPLRETYGKSVLPIK
jgi:hypothetical protein